MRILLADDHRLLLEGLTNLLSAKGHTVVATASDGYEALEQARRHRPDAVLMDVRMPRCDGLTATRLLSAELPEVRVVMLTTSDEDEDLFEAIAAGACGYLLKSVTGEELVEALTGLTDGVPPLSPVLAARLLAEFRRRSTQEATPSSSHCADGFQVAMPPQVPTDIAPLPAERAVVTPTDRQVAVLRLVAAGRTYKEVAAELSLSERTVRYHMAEVMAALHLVHRAEAIAWAGRSGLLERR
jgi:DNA-binding NarL/FixJ family response regulator